VSRSTLESTSFRNPDGQMVSIVMNKTDEIIEYKMIVGESELPHIIPPHSMQTLLY
jgi:glucosylceramidase